ncbi:hypothetical protein ONZ45_g15607 [Pleurotus djamor]|nr:hypothetical protein ONZ45_g15607 [Pleurotus djamor]
MAIEDTISGPSSSSSAATPTPLVPSPTVPRRPFPRCDVPTLSGVLTAPLDGPMVNTWIDRCEDEFDAYTLINNVVLPDQLRILFASMKLEHPDARAWWSERREELKTLGAWTTFASRLRERFVSVNWRLDALARFYSIRQNGPFNSFVAELLSARNALSSAGSGYVLSDSTVKNHILFFSHPILSLRTRATPAFRYEVLRLEQLVSLMAATWSSLEAEGVVSSVPTNRTQPRAALPASGVTRPTVAPASTASTLRPSFVPLSTTERETLRASGGCFHCRRTPASPGWVSHTAANCPGDPSNNIPPRTARPPAAAAVAAVALGDDDLVYYGDADADPLEPVISCYVEGDQYDSDSFSSSGC